jgi:hypothetical protein
MRPRIPQLPPHPRRQHLHLLLPPPQHITKQPQRKPFESVVHLRQVIHANLLELRVTRPRPDGELEFLMDNVREAGFLRRALEQDPGAAGAADLVAGGEEGGDPLQGGGGGGVEGGVVGVVEEVEVLEFGIATGGEVALVVVHELASHW